MGTKISIDKHVSTLDDILEMPPNYFEKIKFESKISQDITQHLKIWKFSEDKRKLDSVKSSPVPLHSLQQSGFYFSSEEAYLLLLVYKAGTEVQSAENLTPRGLANTFSSSEEDRFQSHQFDSFLLSKRRDNPMIYQNAQDEEMKDESQQLNQTKPHQFKYMIFVWNGKQAGALVKAMALTKGYELDDLLQKGKDNVLHVFFAGGVIRGKKLQRSSVLIFDEATADSKKNTNNNATGTVLESQKENPNTPSAEQIIKAYETVYLLKWLFPESIITGQQVGNTISKMKKPKFQNLMQTFKTHQDQKKPVNNYWTNFSNIDNLLDDIEFQIDIEMTEDDNNFIHSNESSDYDDDEDVNMHNISDKNTGSENNPNDFNNKRIIQQNIQQKPADQLKQVLGGGLKPPMNKLNLAGIQRDQQEQEIIKIPHQQQQPSKKTGIPNLGFGGKTGFNLDLSKAQKIKQQDENGQDSQRELIQHQQQQQQQQEIQKQEKVIPVLKMGNEQQQNSSVNQQQIPQKKLGLGFGLDLSKAQSFQQESLQKSEQIIQKAKENSSQEIEGPQLQINISNIAKLRELNQDFSLEQAPAHRRGGADDLQIDTQLSKKILSVSSRGDSEESNMSTIRDLLPPDQLSDEDFDMKGTSRKEYENEYYKRICSEIIDDFLYLGSDFVASDQEILKKNGITHVVNCAADYSANYFESILKYKKYHLKDHVRENIECVFYDAMHFIEDARKENGKVFVHCVQGVSRSATICLAYLIFSQKLNYQESFNYLKERRPVANPNMTFIAQLICYYKRLYELSFESIPVSPRVFIVSSHEIEDPEYIIARMMMENLYQGKNGKVLDPRGMFIIQGRDTIKIWVGSMIPQVNLQPYKQYAENYIKVLQKYERAPKEYTFVNQYEEDLSFWKLFNLESKPQKDYEIIGEWNTIFIDLQKARQQDKKAPVVTQMQNYREIVSNEQIFKPRLFVYPDSQSSQTVFDLDDLSEDNFVILCVKANPDEGIDEDILYLWKGPEFEQESATNTEEFIQQVIKKYWGENADNEIQIERIEQVPGNEDDDFLNYFD